jgi:hypothetical protein
MTLPLKTIIDPSFVRSFARLCEQPLALADSLALARAARLIEEENANFNRARVAFFKAHGTPDGENWRLDPDQPDIIVRYNQEMETALATRIDLSMARGILLTPECKLTALELLPLLDLLDGEEKAKR